MQEQANELAEARLKVDRDMVHAMCELTNALSRVRVEGPMGVSPGEQVGEGSWGVGWPGVGLRASKGKGKEWAVEEGEGVGDEGSDGSLDDDYLG